MALPMPPTRSRCDTRCCRRPQPSRRRLRRARRGASTNGPTTTPRRTPAAAVEVRYEMLPAAATVEAALAPGAARVFDEWPDNVAGPSTGSVGDVTRGFAQAHAIVEARLSVPRVAA